MAIPLQANNIRNKHTATPGSGSLDHLQTDELIENSLNALSHLQHQLGLVDTHSNTAGKQYLRQHSDTAAHELIIVIM